MRATPQRVALYARVSTSEQNPENQLHDLQQVATQRGWVVVESYIDHGVSGTTARRPALDRMLADAQAGHFDLVLVARLDRLGRSLQHLLHVLAQLKRFGVGFVSVGDPGIDTSTPMGELLLQVIGAFAQYERALIVDRVTAGVHRARREGKRLGRPPKPVDVEVAQRRLVEGSSLRSVALEMGTSPRSLRRALSSQGAASSVGQKPVSIGRVQVVETTGTASLDQTRSKT